jgi:hypothetical protein
MRNKKAPIINIITYRLPFKLTNQIYNEYKSRLREAKYMIKLYERYKPLAKYIKTVENLLALTIFYKRVISNLDAAVKFYGTVNKYSCSDTIQIGSHNFTEKEKNKLLGLIINYNNLMRNFGLPINLNDYELTKEFLAKLLLLLKNPEYDKRNRGKNKTEEDELPF